MVSQVNLRTLGELALERTDGVDCAALVAQPKRLALLLYLALAQPLRFHRRDVLLAMFWPELDRARAGRSLRQALHFLRRALPEGMIVTRGGEEVAVAHNRIRADATDFERALDQGREADGLPLQRGDLLPGFHISGCPDFERWLDAERARLRLRAARSALLLAHRFEQSSDAEPAAEWTRKAISFAPYDELALREAVELLDRLGDRAGAISMCDTFIERLRDELGADVSERTRTLATQLRAPGARSSRGSPDSTAGAETIPVGAAVRALATHAAGAAPLLTDRIGVEALHAYQRALHHQAQRNPQAMQRALEEYLKALRYEPDFALAHVGVARVLIILAVYTPCQPAEMYARAKHHATKAVALDPSLTQARLCLAHTLACSEWDWVGAERRFVSAIEDDPRSAEARELYALYVLTPTGRFEQAIREIELSRELDPTSLPISTYTGAIYYFARQYERAVRELRLTLELDASYSLAWWFLAMAYEELQKFDDALDCALRAATLTADSPLMLVQVARIRARAGDHAAARHLLAHLEHDAGMPYFIAGVHAALGEPDAALEWLQRAYGQRSPHLVFASVFPPHDVLRGERRFRELLLRMGLRPSQSQISIHESGSARRPMPTGARSA